MRRVRAAESRVDPAPVRQRTNAGRDPLVTLQLRSARADERAAAGLLTCRSQGKEGTMPQTPQKTPQIDHIPEDESRALPVNPPKLETPVIQSQDLEHQPRSEVRVNTKGVKVTPHLDGDDQRDFEKEDEEALKAMEEIEKQYREQPPG
jgi:hypothetical protein